MCDRQKDRYGHDAGGESPWWGPELQAKKILDFAQERIQDWSHTSG